MAIENMKKGFGKNKKTYTQVDAAADFMEPLCPFCEEENVSYGLNCIFDLIYCS